MATPFDKLMGDSGPSSFDSAMGVHEFDAAMDDHEGMLEGYKAGVEDFVRNLGGLGKGALNLIQNPNEIGGVVSEGAGAIGHSVMHPVDLVKGIVWDGIVKPVVWNNLRQVFDPSLTQEDRFTLGRESALGMSGLALGEGAGRAISMLGRGAEAAAKLKLVTKASTVEEMVDVVSNTLTPKEALLAASHAQDALSHGGYIKAALRTAPVGAGSGFAMGVAQTNDPNEAFKQGLVNGMVGAFLGPVFHGITKGSNEGYSKIRAIGIERARDDMFTSLLKNAPDLTLEQTLKGVDFVKVGAKNLPAGEGFIFHNLPDYISTDKLPDNAVVRDFNGKKSVLVTGKQSSKSTIKEFTDLADAQRGAPEDRMLDIQKTQIAPLFGYTAEHVGDLTNRMAQNPVFFKGMYDTVGEKVDKTLRSLKHGYGFGKEVNDQITSYAKSKSVTFNEANDILVKAGKAYADAHAALPVYNAVQMIARDAAVALGNMDFKGAINNLEILKGFLANKETWEAAAMKGLPNLENAARVDFFIKQWKETGFIPNQLIQFKGVDHQFLGVEKGFASIRDLSDGRIHRTSFKNLSPSSGRVVQVEYKPGEEMLIGKKYSNPGNPNMFAVLSKNTKVGEKPWRISYFVKDAEGKIDNYIHQDFESANAAADYVTSTPPPNGEIMTFKGIKSSDKLQGYVESDSKSTSKPGEVTSRLNTPFQVQEFPHIITEDLNKAITESPEDYAIYKSNIDRAVDEQYDDAHKFSTSLASNEVMAERLSDGSYEVKNAEGKFVGVFSDLTKLYDFADGLSGGGGDLIPGVPGVRSVGFDDSASFSMNQNRNFVNALRDWTALRFSNITTPYSYFTSLETKYGRKFFNEFFLPLQHARTAYNKRLAGLADYINPLIAMIAVLEPERKGFLSNAQEAFSSTEILSDKPSILARVLSDAEKRIGQMLGNNSTKDDRVLAYQYIRSEIQLKDELQGKSKEEMNRIAADFIHAYKDITPIQKKTIEIMKSVRGESIDDISLYAVNRLADAIEFKSLSREDYMNVNKFSPEERKLVNEIEKVYRILGDEFGIDKGSRLGGYITHAIDYDGKVVDGSVITNSRWLPAKTRDFIYAAVRTGEMQDLIRDPGELLKKYVTQGAKTETLYPAVTNAKTWLKTAYSGLDRGTAEAINEKSTSYMNQILGQIDPQDALVASETINKASGAFIKTLNRLGIRDDSADKWLKRYFKISELATQGFKPIAGLRDATSTLMYWYARFGTKRLASMLSDWNQATDSKGILQESGKIPGLTVEFFTGMDGALNGKSFLDKAAETGFKYSGQPYVYQQFHAMAYINTIKTVLSAASDLEAKKISQKVFERKIGLSTYDIPQVKQFTQLLRSQPLEAAKYLADVTGREVVGYYGMANHPFFMSSKLGKVIGQHGQWPLWMLQNFGRLASQGSRSQRLITAAKIGAMFAAIQYGGRSAGFNLGSWTFSPDNAMFLGGPLAQSGMWGAIYLGTNDPTQREFATRMLERMTRTDRSQYFLPMPSQAYNMGWAMARMSNGDPPLISFGQMIGLPIDQAQYPKPQ